MVKQVSVFLENKEGRLVRALKYLGENSINIRALSIAETADFGILRLIVDKPEKASSVLKNAGFRVIETDVLAVEVSDEPGGLAQILGYLAKEKINIEATLAGNSAMITSSIIFLTESDVLK